MGYPEESNTTETAQSETLYKGIGDFYTTLPEQALVINALAAGLIALAILIPCILKCDSFKKGLKTEAYDEEF